MMQWEYDIREMIFFNHNRSFYSVIMIASSRSYVPIIGLLLQHVFCQGQGDEIT